MNPRQRQKNSAVTEPRGDAGQRPPIKGRITHEIVWCLTLIRAMDFTHFSMDFTHFLLIFYIIIMKNWVKNLKNKNGFAMHPQHVFHFFLVPIFYFSEFLFLIIFYFFNFAIFYPIFPVYHLKKQIKICKINRKI